MALVRKERFEGGTVFGLWRMDEPVEAFHTLGEVYAEVCHTYPGAHRRLEVLCAYALLFALTGDRSLHVDHLPSGQPRCVSEATGRCYHISISHTEGWVAVIMSEKSKVAVDIEYISDRVCRVVSRFLRDDEPFTQGRELQLCWCAKEAAYKYYSEQNLMFREMCVAPFAIADAAQGPTDTLKKETHEGRLSVHNLRTAQTLALHYQINSRYVLVYAIEGH